MTEWLTDNPIANLRGPEFLSLYLLLIFAVCLWARYRVRTQDPTEAPAPLIPNRPDPYELAWLRGGQKALAEVLCFGLAERGYLEIIDDNRLIHSENRPDPRRLTDLERAVYEWIGAGRSFGELRKFRELAPQLAAVGAQYQQRAEANGLLWNFEQRRRALWIAISAAALIDIVGLYKLLMALAHGRSNVLFLMMLLVLGPIGVLFSALLPRLTPRGKQYLQQLQTAFAQPNPPLAAIGGSDVPLTLTMGLLGVAALRGTAYAPYTRVWMPPASEGGGVSGDSGGSSDSSSCSSSDSGGGSSCSSGCGGCSSS